MKKFSLLFLGLALVSLSFGQGSWTQKTSFPGGARNNAVGFSIGSSGYLGTGSNTNQDVFNDFYQYNASNDAWTKKSDFGGSARHYAAGFGLKGSGYIATGIKKTGAALFDTWKYDPNSDAWTGSANTASGVILAVGTSNGTKGFLVTGSTGGAGNQTWVYDTTTTWLWDTFSNFPGDGRNSAAGFTIGDKLYVGTGSGGAGVYYKDFYEYNSSSDTWTKKADFPGEARYGATGFAVNGRGYIGLGSNGAFPYQKDFYEYNPANDAWTKVADFGGLGRYYAVAFVIDGKAYVGTGAYTADMWEFTPPAHVGFEEDLEMRNFLVQPNPVHDKLYLHRNDFMDWSRYEIYNVVGQMVLDGKVLDSSIDLGDLEKGLYFLKTGKNGNWITSKFMKE